MRIQAGNYIHTSTNGTPIHADQPLSQEQVDMIVQILEAEGRPSGTVLAIEFDGEQPPTIEPSFKRKVVQS